MQMAYHFLQWLVHQTNNELSVANTPVSNLRGDYARQIWKMQSCQGFVMPLGIRMNKLSLDLKKRKWRRGWDSNPRWSYPHSGFRDRPVQPLQHLSESGKRNSLRDQKRFVARNWSFAILFHESNSYMLARSRHESKNCRPASRNLNA